MVGHDHKRIALHVEIMPWQISPHLFHNRPEFIETRFTVANSPEHHGPCVRDNRNEIRARLRIIVSRSRIERRRCISASVFIAWMYIGKATTFSMNLLWHTW
jgi:hypothetical protein